MKVTAEFEKHMAPHAVIPSHVGHWCVFTDDHVKELETSEVERDLDKLHNLWDACLNTVV